jgi:hypothetical protein
LLFSVQPSSTVAFSYLTYNLTNWAGGDLDLDTGIFTAETAVLSTGMSDVMLFLVGNLQCDVELPGRAVLAVALQEWGEGGGGDGSVHDGMSTAGEGDTVPSWSTWSPGRRWSCRRTRE